MSSGSKKIVVVGIVSNAIVTVLKFISALITTSASMMNEAIHSLMDTLNQLFLLFGLIASEKEPDQDYAFGHIKRNLFGTCGQQLVCFQLVRVWVYIMPITLT